MARHAKVKKREVQGDAVYNNKLVAKFINGIMKDGKKTTAENIVYKTFENLSNEKMDPIETFEKAIQNVGPKQEIKARRVGGASYQIPQEVRGERRLSLAIRWILIAAKARANSEFKTFDLKLAAELKDAVDNKGEAVRKRDNVQKMADANKAFSHFRF
jgi:small subunit ribosomal protein S7